MKGVSRTRGIIAVVLVVALTGAIAATYRLGSIQVQTSADDELYLQSSKSLKRFSLGFSGLLANIYWTRAVQYFGAKRLAQSTHYESLYPLLDIATDLDPNLLVAYQDGAIFLSAAPPGGAGEPDRAVDLLEKGVRENPDYWRFYFTLGFVHYMDRKDFAAAHNAFVRGSEVPGALPWMRTMAATMAERAGERTTAAAIWSRLFESTQDRDIRETASQHLTALRVDAEVEALEDRVRLFREKAGQLPGTWVDLVRFGLLRGIPLDPTSRPYRLQTDGSVQVEDPQRFPFITHGSSSSSK
jgi:tetratricopeptide (TPR) repeat protein